MQHACFWWFAIWLHYSARITLGSTLCSCTSLCQSESPCIDCVSSSNPLWRFGSWKVKQRVFWQWHAHSCAEHSKQCKLSKKYSQCATHKPHVQWWAKDAHAVEVVCFEHTKHIAMPVSAIAELRLAVESTRIAFFEYPQWNRGLGVSADVPAEVPLGRAAMRLKNSWYCARAVFVFLQRKYLVSLCWLTRWFDTSKRHSTYKFVFHCHRHCVASDKQHCFKSIKMINSFNVPYV